MEHWALLPFVIGVIVGVSVSTVILIQPSTESVVTNVYIGVDEGDSHSIQLRERLERFEQVMQELHPPEHRGGGPRFLAEEANMKTLVHYTVIMSDPSPDMIATLRNTWARDIPEADVNYFVSPNDETQGVPATETSPNAIELSTDKLLEIQALRHVCEHNINASKWFFFGYDTAYVKTLELESYLLTLEASQDQLPYMGRPVKREPVGRLCLPGPGSLLSSVALSQLCPKVGECKEEAETDCVLGECVRRQLPDIQCNKDFNHPQNLFLKFDGAKKGPIIDPRNTAALTHALTIYPVADPKLMYNIHQLVVSKRLNDSQYFAQELKQTVDTMAAFLPHSEGNYAHGNNEVVKSREDIEPWQLITDNKLMVRNSNNPASKIPQFWKRELDMVTGGVMGYLTSIHDDQQLKFSRVVNAYWRLHPLTGMQYIIDFEAKPSQADQPPIRFFAKLWHSYNPPEVSPIQPQVKSSKRVTIAIVMTGELEQELKAFMMRLSQVLVQDQRLDLIVVIMRTEGDRQVSKKSALETSNLESILHSYQTRYLRASFKIISSPYILSRAYGLALVLHEVRPTDILFLSDLHLSFDASFLDRCRNIPLQGQQVYYPIPFANESLETGVFNSTRRSLLPQSGHWLVKSYGVSCMYAADVLSSTQQAGGKGVPKEVDTDELYQGLLEKEYEVIRSVDSGLWRKQPDNSASACELELVGEEQEPCKIAHGYSYHQIRLRTQLSQMLFDHEKKHSEKKF